MSAPQIPEEAVEAGARGAFDVRDDPYDDDEWEDLDSTDRELYECQSRAVQSAAYPHLRRAILAELIAKLDALPGLGWLGYKAWTGDWLRAELAEGGDGE